MAFDPAWLDGLTRNSGRQKKNMNEITDALQVIATMRSRLSRLELEQAMQVLRAVRDANSENEEDLAIYAFQLIMVAEADFEALETLRRYLQRYMPCLYDDT